VNCANGELLPVVCDENRENFSHQKSNVKPRMHLIRFRMGLPRPPAGFKGPTSKGNKETEWKEGKG